MQPLNQLEIKLPWLSATFANGQSLSSVLSRPEGFTGPHLGELLDLLRPADVNLGEYGLAVVRPASSEFLALLGRDRPAAPHDYGAAVEW